MEKNVEEILERYDNVLTLYLAAQKELSGVLTELQKAGVFKSPAYCLRFPLPDEREGVTHKIEIGAPPKKFEGYVTTGVYSDGEVGEIFRQEIIRSISTTKIGVPPLWNSPLTIISPSLWRRCNPDRMRSRLPPQADLVTSRVTCLIDSPSRSISKEWWNSRTTLRRMATE